jgi:NAD(P)-dependent dehydrogenase (short-subunit alcohol dehydrogenase family)
MKRVIVVIGAGSIGQAIARRVSAGKPVLLADLRVENADAAARTLTDAGFGVSTAHVDVSSRASVHALVERATAIGEIDGVIHAAGVSPSQASPQAILKVDLYGTALVLEESSRTSRSRPRPLKSCSNSRCCSLTKSTNPFTRTRFQSARICCA